MIICKLGKLYFTEMFWNDGSGDVEYAYKWMIELKKRIPFGEIMIKRSYLLTYLLAYSLS